MFPNPMKLKSIVLVPLVLSMAGAASACTFSWQHYGAPQVQALLKERIGEKVPDSYCAQFNKDYEIVVMTTTYQNTEETLAHVAIGLRKRGSEKMLTHYRSGYTRESGNYVVAMKYRLAASRALDVLMDVMSDPGSYQN